MKAINHNESQRCIMLRKVGSFSMLMEDWTRNYNVEEKNDKQSSKYKKK
jgi:hypothetical protein